MGYQRDREDFMVQAARHGVGDFDRRALLRASSTLQRLNEIHSSIEQTEYQEKRTERAMEQAEARANAVVKRLGAGSPLVASHNHQRKALPMIRIEAIAEALDNDDAPHASRLQAELVETCAKLTTTISRTRAKEIAASGKYLDSLPEHEAVEIRRVWNALPGWTCFADVLRLIATGRIG